MGLNELIITCFIVTIIFGAIGIFLDFREEIKGK